MGYLLKGTVSPYEKDMRVVLISNPVLRHVTLDI
jgi:hypothetical protein